MTDDGRDDEGQDELDELYPGVPAVPPIDLEYALGDDVDQDRDGVPDTDPRHLDPAGDLAAEFEDGVLSNASVTEETEREDLREWLTRAESGEFGADPGVEATVRIVRALLDESEE